MSEKMISANDDTENSQQRIRKFSVAWPEDLVERMDELAERLGWTRTKVILSACEQYLQMFEECSEDDIYEVAERSEIKKVLIEILSDPDVVEALKERMNAISLK